MRPNASRRVQPQPVNRVAPRVLPPAAEIPPTDVPMDADDQADPNLPPVPEPLAVGSTKPRSLAFFVQRALTRYLGPELRDFAVACARGSVQPNEVLPDLTAKLHNVAENVARHGPVRSAEEINEIVPVGEPSGLRLPPEAIVEILTMRKAGHSRRAIAKKLGRPTTTIHNVLAREGDPAPRDLLAKEAATKRKLIENLQKQLQDMGQ